jgi:hypothetical protein
MSRHRAIPGGAKFKRKNFTQVNVYGNKIGPNMESLQYRNPARGLKQSNHTMIDEEL